MFTKNALRKRVMITCVSSKVVYLADLEVKD
jgi:hypothetical protein